MERVGKPFDHGLPPEVEADNDLEALRCAAELVERALEQVGSIEIGEVQRVVYPLLDRAVIRLRGFIKQIEAGEKQA